MKTRSYNNINTYHLNDQILMINLESKPRNKYLIQVHFLTSQSLDEKIKIIYD